MLRLILSPKNLLCFLFSVNFSHSDGQWPCRTNRLLLNGSQMQKNVFSVSFSKCKEKTLEKLSSGLGRSVYGTIYLLSATTKFWAKAKPNEKKRSLMLYARNGPRRWCIAFYSRCNYKTGDCARIVFQFQFGKLLFFTTSLLCARSYAWKIDFRIDDFNEARWPLAIT